MFYRAQLNEESAQAFANLFEQWNEDFKKFREQHEKLVVGIAIAINLL